MCTLIRYLGFMGTFFLNCSVKKYKRKFKK